MFGGEEGAGGSTLDGVEEDSPNSTEGLSVVWIALWGKGAVSLEGLYSWGIPIRPARLSWVWGL